MIKVIVAPDSFKGCLSAGEAAEAMSDGIRRMADEIGVSGTLDIVGMPVADGGEGTSAALAQTTGAEKVSVRVPDPLMRPVDACFYFDDSSATAYVDVASASGITLLGRDELDVMKATTFGTGVLLREAVGIGAKRILLGAGGSATNDAGMGALQALGARFYRADGSLLPDGIGGRNLDEIGKTDLSGLNDVLNGTDISILTDVGAPFCGPDGAAMVFGRQKGASESMARMLDSAMARFAQRMNALGFVDISCRPGAGAAGGLAGGFLLFTSASVCNGIDAVLDACGFDESLRCASLVFTGEGKSDRQTLMNKAPYGVLRRCLRSGVPVALLSGVIAEENCLEKAGFSFIKDINSDFIGVSDADPLHPDVARMRLSKASAGIFGRYVRDFC